MENQRLLFAAFLSALVLIVWSSYFAPPPVQSPAPDPAAVETISENDPRQAAEAASADSTSVEPAAAMQAAGEPETGEGAVEQAAPQSIEEIAAAAESTWILESEKLRAEFTNRGAQLVSFQIKSTREGEEDLELVRRRGSDPNPFALVLEGARSHPLNKALFEVEETRTDDGLPELRFRHRSSLGDAEKIFRWTSEGLLGADLTVKNSDDWGVLLGPGIRNLDDDEDADSRWIQRMASYRRGEDIETVAPKKQDEDILLLPNNLTWVALEDNFFLSAAIPVEGLRSAIIRPVLQRLEVEAGKPRFLPLGADSGEKELTTVQLVLLEASGERLEFLSYFGDKQYKHLVAMPYHLEGTVHWGNYLGLLARPLYYGLEYIHSNVVPNYGWAIVLVTLLIRILFFPLTWKSQESMSKMQELNPKIQAIRTKYKSKLKDKQGRPNLDAQRQMNEEVMTIYKTAGVNPVSGCFPILLQMPVFFAFYRLLATTVELRGAPWIAWIHDLSIPDPIFLLPLLMGGTNVAMQKMMPQSPDPMQRRMMQMMPLMFMVFALWFPAGLVLYWLTNNLLTMAQQALLNKRRKSKAAAAA